METSNIFLQNHVCQPNTTSLNKSEPIDDLFFADDSLNSLAGELQPVSVDARATLPDNSSLPHDCFNSIKESSNESICIPDHIIERCCEGLDDITSKWQLCTRVPVSNPFTKYAYTDAHTQTSTRAVAQINLSSKFWVLFLIFLISMSPNSCSGGA